MVEKPAARVCPPPPWARAITRHVDLVVGGPQRDFALAGALAAQDLADEHRHLRAAQRPQVVDDALGVAFLGPGGGEVLGRQGDQRELAVVVALDPRQRDPEQRELADRHVLVQAPVDAGDVDAGLDQLGGHLVRARRWCSRT